MEDINDSARKTDAGTKLLDRQAPSGSGLSSGAKAARKNEPAGSTNKNQGEIDDAARATDAGTKLLNRQASQKTGTGSKKAVTPPAPATPIIYPGAQGRNVWAVRPDAGNWLNERANGWDRPIVLRTVKSFLDELKKPGLGQIGKLAIVAHGNHDGVVQLESQSPLTPESLNAFKPQLTQLAGFIMPHGKMIFVSCIAGRGAGGTTLLTGISTILPHIYVIGFEIFGATSGRTPSVAGQVYEDKFGTTSLRSLENFDDDVPLTEYSYFSKWALDGRIIRFPRTEQADRDKKKCANPSCPGHRSTNDKCDIFP